MMQGFYMLALQRRAAKGASPWAACILALACAFFAARAYFAPSAVAANAPLEPYVAYDAGRDARRVPRRRNGPLYGDRHPFAAAGRP